MLMPNRDSVPGLAAKLRAAREAAGLTQIQAGERSGVHHVSIAKFETDKSTPTLRVLYRLADAYGVDVADLLPTAKKPRK
jgi:transcriptional regulator with XRE-family HTH domain